MRNIKKIVVIYILIISFNLLFSQENENSQAKFLITNAANEFFMERYVNYNDLLSAKELMPDSWQVSILRAKVLSKTGVMKYRVSYLLEDAVLRNPTHPIPYIASYNYYKTQNNKNVVNQLYRELNTLIPGKFLLVMAGYGDVQARVLEDNEENKLSKEISHHLADEDIMSALPLAEQLLELSPNNMEYRLLITTLYSAVEDYERVDEAIHGLNNSTLSYAILYSNLLIKTGKTEEAEIFLSETANKFDDSRIKFMLGKLCYERGNYVDGSLNFHSYLKDKSGSYTVHIIEIIAESYLKRGDNDAAYLLGKKFLEIERPTVYELCVGAEIVAKSGHYKESLNKYSYILTPAAYSPLSDADIYYELAFLNVLPNVMAENKYALGSIKYSLENVINGSKQNPVIAAQIYLTVIDNDRQYEETAVYLISTFRNDFDLLYMVAYESLLRGKHTIFHKALDALISLRSKTDLELYNIAQLYFQKNDRVSYDLYMKAIDVDLFSIFKKQANYVI